MTYPCFSISNAESEFQSRAVIPEAILFSYQRRFCTGTLASYLPLHSYFLDPNSTMSEKYRTEPLKYMAEVPYIHTFDILFLKAQLVGLD